jgi:hypothetical protein
MVQHGSKRMPLQSGWRKCYLLASVLGGEPLEVRGSTVAIHVWQPPVVLFFGNPRDPPCLGSKHQNNTLGIYMVGTNTIRKA